jgi:hypothetical protein
MKGAWSWRFARICALVWETLSRKSQRGETRYAQYQVESLAARIHVFTCRGPSSAFGVSFVHKHQCIPNAQNDHEAAIQANLTPHSVGDIKLTSGVRGGDQSNVRAVHAGLAAELLHLRSQSPVRIPIRLFVPSGVRVLRTREQPL